MASAIEIAAGVRSGTLKAVDVVEQHLAAHRRPRAGDPRLQPGDGRPGPRRAAESVDAMVAAGDDPGPLGRRADRAQGQHVHAWRADHVLVEDPRGLEAAVRRDHRHQAGCRRRGGDRQDQPRRVRHGIQHRELGVRADPQPARHVTGAGWQQRRQRGRSRRRFRIGRSRQRHRRIDPPAGRAVRRGRRQADLRLRQSLRPDRVRQQPRSDRPVRHQRRRRRPTARRDRRPRSDGLDVDPGRASVARRCDRSRCRGPARRSDHRPARGRRSRRRRAGRGGVRCLARCRRDHRRRAGSGVHVRSHCLLPHRSRRRPAATWRATTECGTACVSRPPTPTRCMASPAPPASATR